jgi:hypothetical protein
MMFDAQVFELPKDAEYPEQNQDAWAFDPRCGIAAIADGVASSLFARRWARILTEAAAADPPDPEEPKAFWTWLEECRQTWRRRIDVSELAWHQKAKLPGGAFSTLLWLTVVARPDPAAWSLRAHAVGDSCLFLVRGGTTVQTFPIRRSSELEASPMVLGSVDLHHDHVVEFRRMEAECRPGDLLVLSTDAVAAWALRREEAGTPVDWEAFWDMPEATWQQQVMALRDRRQMRYDDTTMVLLRIVPQDSTKEM